MHSTHITHHTPPSCLQSAHLRVRAQLRPQPNKPGRTADRARSLHEDTPVPAVGAIATESGAVVGGVVDWKISFSRFRFCICPFGLAESATSADGPITAPNSPVKVGDAAFKVSVGVKSAIWEVSLSQDAGGLGVVSTGADCAEAPGAFMSRSKSTISPPRTAKNSGAGREIPSPGGAVDEGIEGIASARTSARLML
jgi:hypothetical protein